MAEISHTTLQTETDSNWKGLSVAKPEIDTTLPDLSDKNKLYLEIPPKAEQLNPKQRLSIGKPGFSTTLPDLCETKKVYLETNLDASEQELNDDSNSCSSVLNALKQRISTAKPEISTTLPDLSDKNKLFLEKPPKAEPGVINEAKMSNSLVISTPEIVIPITIYNDPPKSYPSAREQMDNETAHERRKKYLESRRIDRMLAKEQKLLARERTIILLGSGGSGKSTVCKQMKLLNGDGFSSEERQDYKSYIHMFILINVKKIIKLVPILKLSYNDSDSQKIATELSHINLSEGQLLDEESSFGIQKLLKSAPWTLIINRTSEFNLDDSFTYFAKDVGFILSESYTPRNQGFTLLYRYFDVSA